MPPAVIQILVSNSLLPPRTINVHRSQIRIHDERRSATDHNTVEHPLLWPIDMREPSSIPSLPDQCGPLPTRLESSMPPIVIRRGHFVSHITEWFPSLQADSRLHCSRRLFSLLSCQTPSKTSMFHHQHQSQSSCHPDCSSDKAHGTYAPSG